MSIRPQGLALAAAFEVFSTLPIAEDMAVISALENLPDESTKLDAARSATRPAFANSFRSLIALLAVPTEPQCRTLRYPWLYLHAVVSVFSRPPKGLGMDGWLKGLTATACVVIIAAGSYFA